MAAKNTKRDIRLDLLRAGAMLYIIGFWHITDYSSALPYRNSFTGFLTTCALGLFVFLSGLLLAKRYAISSLNEASRFIVRRISRIYPLFVLAAALFYAFEITSLEQTLKGLVALNLFTGTPQTTLWFVEMIMLFYLLTPLFLYKYSLRKTLTIGCGLTCLFAAATHITHETVDPRLARYAIVFTAGLIVGRSRRFERVLDNRWALIAALAFFPLFYWAGTQAKGALAIIMIQAGILAFMPIAFNVSKWISKWLPARTIGIVAYASFAMYLLHRITGSIAASVYFPTTLIVSLLYLYLVWMPATFLIAWGVQRVYDSVSRRLAGNTR